VEHPVTGEFLFIVQGILLIGLPELIFLLRPVRRTVPLVVVQILLGIALGPGLLGRFAPVIYETLFPPESLLAHSGLAWTALIFFGFLTGTHFNTREIIGRGKSFAITSASALLVPFALCVGVGLLALWFFPAGMGAHATPLVFVLGIGIAGSVTALPVLSATLIDMGLIHRSTGRLALGYAMVHDGLLWILVSVLLTLTGPGEPGILPVLETILLTLLFAAVMVVLVRPALVRLVDNGTLEHDPHNGQLVALACLVLLSALATQAIGVHFLLGSFLCGAIMPKAIVAGLQGKMDPVVSVVLLPFFFMSAGHQARFEFDSWEMWLLCLLVTFVSSFGKFFGTMLPARYVGSGFTWARAATLGALMQCKGLMEVVVLTMMLQAEIITPTAFSGLLLMAIITTAITKPLVLLISELTHRAKRSDDLGDDTQPGLAPESASG
jgi:Kef-type K+ transport system membrane component KefB